MDEQDRAALQRNKEMRYKRFHEDVLERIPGIAPEACFFTPYEVQQAVENYQPALDWHKWLLEEYEPPKNKVALLYPDSDRKPWVRGETTDRTYKYLYISLKSLKLLDKVQVFTVSSLLGIVPMEKYAEMPLYDTSGLFSWSVRKRGLEWDAQVFKDTLQTLGGIVSTFIEKHQDKYDKWVALYRTPSIHERIVENAYDIRPFPLVKKTQKKPLSKSYSLIKDLLKDIEK